MILPGLAGLAILLVVVLAAEIALDRGQAPAAERAPPPAAAQADAGGATRVADRTPAWTASLLARPLFNTDRRPVAPAAAAGGPASATLPRLAGILLTPSGKRAIFAGPNGGKQVAVAETGRLGAYTVTRIEDGAVTLAGPDGMHRIRPSFAGGAEAAAIEPPAAPDPVRQMPPGSAPSGLDLIANPPPLLIPAAPRR